MAKYNKEEGRRIFDTERGVVGRRGSAILIEQDGPDWVLRSVRFDEGRVIDITEIVRDVKPIVLAKAEMALERQAGL